MKSPTTKSKQKIKALIQSFKSREEDVEITKERIGPKKKKSSIENSYKAINTMMTGGRDLVNLAMIRSSVEITTPSWI